MKSIGIIGAGFSGTMTAIQLMKQATSPLKIYLIDKNEMARGQAYADISPELLLNVRADHMGAFPDDAKHFYQWLQNKKIKAASDDFISRKIYGDYLHELLDEAVEKSKALVKIKMIKDQVIDLNPDKKELLFRTHSPIEVDQLVLAMGLESPLQFNFSDLKNSREPITIIGTGLSMVDVIIYLKSINYLGKITAVSRRGKLPQPHKFYDPSIPRPSYDFSKDHSLKHALSVVKNNIKKFEWRLAIDTLRPHTPVLWKNWTVKERGQFLRHLRGLWDTHRHRMIPIHRNIIDGLISSGRLEIKATHFKPYIPTTKVVINCHGLSHQTNALAKKLIERKIVRADEFKLGIESQLNWVHPVGPLRRGQLWESTAASELRAQARDLAGELLSAL